MRCPHCKLLCKAPLIETRQEMESTVRRRQCPHCDKTFCTREAPDTTITIHRVQASRAKIRFTEKRGLKATSLAAFGVWR